MTSFDVFTLFYCFLSPIEQFTLHVSKHNIPNKHATITSEGHIIRGKQKVKKKKSLQVIFK